MEYWLCIFVSLSLTLETLDLQICSGWATVFLKRWCRSVFLLKPVPINFVWLLLNGELVKTPDTQRDCSLFCPLPHSDLSIPLLSASSSFPPYCLCLFSICGDFAFLASFLNRLVEKGIWWEMCFAFLMGLMARFWLFFLRLNISSVEVADNLLSLAGYPHIKWCLFKMPVSSALSRRQTTSALSKDVLCQKCYWLSSAEETLYGWINCYHNHCVFFYYTHSEREWISPGSLVFIF